MAGIGGNGAGKRYGFKNMMCFFRCDWLINNGIDRSASLIRIYLYLIS